MFKRETKFIEKIKERESVRMTILISLKKINFDVNKFLCTGGVK
jgi:hypothetical protein